MCTKLTSVDAAMEIMGTMLDVQTILQHDNIAIKSLVQETRKKWMLRLDQVENVMTLTFVK